MKYRTVFLLVIAPLYSISQTFKISGRVIDTATKDPVSYVNIYLIGTTVGTYTDKDGNFLIETTKWADSIAVIEVGYIAVKKKVYPHALSNLVFELQENISALTEVSIIANSDPGRTLMKKVIARKLLNNPNNVSFA